jgi:5-methylcytosine-specific restriction protein A
MPTKPPAICHHCHRVGCNCREKSRRESDRERGTRTERGYDNDWLRFSEAFKREHPLCQDCLEQGIVRPGNEVHHIKKLRDNPEAKYDEDNLRNLCKVCHSRRTGKGE